AGFATEAEEDGETVRKNGVKAVLPDVDAAVQALDAGQEGASLNHGLHEKLPDLDDQETRDHERGHGGQAARSGGDEPGGGAGGEQAAEGRPTSGKIQQQDQARQRDELGKDAKAAEQQQQNGHGDEIGDVERMGLYQLHALAVAAGEKRLEDIA